MVRWIFAILPILQPAGVLAAERCGGARLTKGNVEMLVLVEQTGSEPPITTHVSTKALGPDGKMTLSSAYEETPEQQIVPRQFFVYSAPSAGITERHREAIRWRRDEGDWRKFPQALYGDNRGEYLFKIAQKGIYKNLTWGTEHLDELRLGGTFAVTRLSEAGEELSTSLIKYPDNVAVNVLYNQVRPKAIADLKPCRWSAPTTSAAPSK